MPEFAYTDLLPMGEDTTPYRLVTSEGVSTFEADGRTFLKVEPEALRKLAEEAIHDIQHYLRPAHLAQLRRIIDDPEASANDRFVATDRAAARGTVIVNVDPWGSSTSIPLWNVHLGTALRSRQPRLAERAGELYLSKISGVRRLMAFRVTKLPRI